MKTLLFLLSISILLASCELFVIGTKKQPIIEISQSSPVGTVLLFKAKLDSSKVADASSLMLKHNGAQYLAIEKYELFDDLTRLSRVISLKPVTDYRADTVQSETCTVFLEVDYIKKYKFQTLKVSDLWYITAYQNY